MKFDEEAIIKAYNDGISMHTIAKNFHTYPTTIKRILERHGVELRHDVKKKGLIWVNEGDKLLEWAKAQGRLVSKRELATVIGKTRLSPAYFIKYPELGEYVKTDIQTCLQPYYDQLYTWLKENNIPYKPGDRTKLKVSLDALLLGEYSGLAIQIAERPYYISKKKHKENLRIRTERSEEIGLIVLFLYEKQFENLDELKIVLDAMKD